MVTGVTTPWGIPIPTLGNMTGSLNKNYTNQLGLTSYPPTFVNGNYVSTMTYPHNSYNQVNFGRSRFGNYRTFDPNRRLVYVPVYQNNTWNRPCPPCRNTPCKSAPGNVNTLLARSGANYNCYDRTDKRMTLNGKTFTINSKAYHAQGQVGTIIGMGCKQILILNNNGIVKRVKISNFIELNK
jgi:hypothetical protein